ncbi:hypothetical protein FQN54_005935 [Arachnomyces sp. PD_36]|nr:hypothetical protein FQN54_005935 [Arachnomyces sp. PD_36]
MLTKPPPRCWLPRRRRTYASPFSTVPTSRTRPTVSETGPDGGPSNINASIHKLDDLGNRAGLEAGGREDAAPRNTGLDTSLATPAEVLRFAVTETFRGQRTTWKHQSRTPQDSAWEQQVWDRIFQAIPRNSRAPPTREREHAISRLGTTRSMRDLQVVMTHVCRGNDAAGVAKIQGDLVGALSQRAINSEYETVLATMNSLLVWFKKLGATELRDFFLCGMRYACLSASPQALKHYLQEYRSAGYGTFTAQEALSLVRTLERAVKVRTWENPSQDMSPMLRAVTGLSTPDGIPKNNHPTLHSLLPWEESSAEIGTFLPPYVRLLGHLRDVHTLAELLSKVRGLLGAEPTTSTSILLSSCLLALVKAGAPQTAIQAVHAISSDCELHSLVTSSLWRVLLEHDYNGSLKDLIRDPELDGVFALELRDIENRLGVKWSGGEDGEHVDCAKSATIPTALEDENFAVLDDENPGLESTERLLAEIQARGSSKSTSDLSAIVDLLHGHEGREVPLGSIKKGQNDAMELAWFPQCSPVEFSGSPTPAGNDQSTPSSLGLVRARPDRNGFLRKSGSALYLIQTGYLSARAKHVGQGLHIEDNPWQETGHIVAWDRISEKFLLLFTGVGRGTVPSNLLQPSVRSTPLPYGSATLNLSALPSGYNSNFTDLLVDTSRRRYWLDVDPGVGIIS